LIKTNNVSIGHATRRAASAHSTDLLIALFLNIITIQSGQSLRDGNL